jgi:hypothetical protein
MKRYTCDFYKPGGKCDAMEVIPLKEERRAKNKHFMQFILVCLGDSVELEFKMMEDGMDNVYKKVVESGQSILVD